MMMVKQKQNASDVMASLKNMNKNHGVALVIFPNQ